jgi:hypothetical protein
MPIEALLPLVSPIDLTASSAFPGTANLVDPHAEPLNSMPLVPRIVSLSDFQIGVCGGTGIYGMIFRAVYNGTGEIVAFKLVHL